MATLTLNINDTSIEPSHITLGTYGSVGVDRLSFVFSAEWDGLLTKATFYPAYGSPVEMLASGEVVVPPEMYKRSGVGKLVISGYAIDNNVLQKRKYTLPCEMEIPNTIVRKGENSVPETPNIYEQLRSQMQTDIAEALQEAKNSGEFDGAPATVDVSATITVPSGSPAEVINQGTSTNAMLVFRIPNGEQGEKGERGASGIYVLEDGETEADIPADADVALFPNGQSITLLDGRGIVSVYKTGGSGASGSTDTYTISYTDNTTSLFQVYNGKDGTGLNIKGFKNSASELPSTATVGDAYLVGTASPYDVYVYGGSSFTNIGAINGVKGDAGRGIISINRTSGNGTAGTVDTYTITYTDSTTSTFTVRNGANGSDGSDGSPGLDGNGISTIVKPLTTGVAGTTDTYTIVMTNGTSSTFDVYNGKDGTGASVTVDTEVVEGSTNPVSGGAVWNNMETILNSAFSYTDHSLNQRIGNFENVATQMETLIGG